MQPDVFLIADWPHLIQTVERTRVCRSKSRYSLQNKDIIPKSIKSYSIIYSILMQWRLLRCFSFSQLCSWIFKSLGMLRHDDETALTETSKACSSSRTPLDPGDEGINILRNVKNCLPVGQWHRKSIRYLQTFRRKLPPPYSSATNRSDRFIRNVGTCLQAAPRHTPKQSNVQGNLNMNLEWNKVKCQLDATR